MRIAWRKGTVTIEFALIALLLFVLLFWIIDLGMMFYANLTMQSAVREGARYAVVGLNDLDPNDDPTLRTQRNAVIERIRQQSLGIYDRYCEAPDFSNLEGPDYATETDIPPESTTLGGPDQIIIISVTCHWPVLTPLMKTSLANGIYNFTVKSTMKNEPS
jgi:Flp pilus assembly protein TadG